MREHTESDNKEETGKPGDGFRALLLVVSTGLFILVQAGVFEQYPAVLTLACVCVGALGFAMGYQPQFESPEARWKTLYQELLARALVLVPLAWRLAWYDDTSSLFGEGSLPAWLRFIRILVLLLSVLLLTRVIAINVFRNRYPNEAVIHPAPEQVEEEEEDEPLPEVDPAHLWFL